MAGLPARLLPQSIVLAASLIGLMVVPGLDDAFVRPKRLLLFLITTLGALGLLLRCGARDRLPLRKDLGALLLSAGLLVGCARASLATVALVLPILVLILVPLPSEWFDAQEEWFPKTFIWACALEVALLVLQLLGHDPFHPTDALSFGKWKIYGTLGNPNRVAWWLSTGFLCLFASSSRPGSAAPSAWRGWRGWGVLQRWGGFRTLGLLWLGAGILMTLSRGASLGVLVAVWASAWLAAHETGRTTATFRVPIMVSVATLGVFIAVATVCPPEWSRWVVNVNSITGRLRHLEECWNIAVANPLLGTGFSRYGELRWTSAEYVHSEYLRSFTEAGLLGGLCITLGLGLMLRRILRTGRASGLPVLIGVAVMGIADAPLVEPAVFVIVLYSFLRLMNTCPEETTSVSFGAMGRSVFRVVATVAAACCAIAVLADFAAIESVFRPAVPSGKEQLDQVFRPR